MTFQMASRANLKPSPTSHIVLLKQHDGSYTGYEVANASPYRVIRVTPNFQKQVSSCSPALPSEPVVFPQWALLSSGGYIVVKSHEGPRPQSALDVAVFDSTLNLVSAGMETPRLDADTSPVALVDLNGDGIPDLIANACNFKTSSCELRVELGSGGASFQSPVIAAYSGLGGFSVALGDLNGDGKLDIVAASYGAPLTVLLGNGDGTFRESPVQPLYSALALAIADMNGDGKPDLVLTTQSAEGASSVAVALGNGDGTFGPPAAFAVRDQQSLAIADVNGDGIPDIVTGGTGISILFGNGKGAFPSRRDYWQDATGGIILADFDGDGKIDIVVAAGDPSVINGSSIAVLYGRGGGFFSGAPVSLEPGLTAVNGPPAVIVAADFNQDGISDLAVQSTTGVRIMLGAGDGNFLPGFEYKSGGSQEALVTADFNHDGKPDLAIAIEDVAKGRIDVLLGKGDGTFQSPISTPAIHGQTGLVAADFNHDGKQDLTVIVSTQSLPSSHQVLIYLGDGNGGFASPVSYAIEGDPSAIAAGDFNGDGKLDLVIANSGDNGNGNLNLLLGKGDGTFSAPATIPFTVNATIAHAALAVADFNHDGILDISVAFADGTVRILLGRGDGTFQSPLLLPYSRAYGLLATDLNGDSIPDLIVWGLTGYVYLLGNGDGTFQPQVTFTFGPGPLVAADLNGDGKVDIASGTASAGVAAFLNTTPKSLPLAIVSSASFAVGPLAPESLATIFGNNLAFRIGAAGAGPLPTDLFGTTVSIRDSGGATRAAPLLYVSPKQINFLVPAGTSSGSATITIKTTSLFSELTQTAQLEIATLAPSLFTLNSDGLAAAVVVRVSPGNVQKVEPVFTLQNGIAVPAPIDLRPPSDQAYLLLFGTGIRSAAAGQVSVAIQGVTAPVTYAGSQFEFPGLDQVNVLLPRDLSGAGDVNVVLSAAGTTSNTVRITIH